ncbi:hypothetical protein OSTOST_09710, partial [Ostertagia ostertagi]
HSHSITAFQEATCSLAHSKLGTWAVTCDGHILVKPNNVDSWVTVAAPPDLPADVSPSQVFSSPNGIYVWILAKGRGWARVNINDRNPSGTKWTETYHTSDLCQLAVGDNIVWAIDASGHLLRLRGLAAGNPAGNYWRPIFRRDIQGYFDRCSKRLMGNRYGESPRTTFERRFRSESVS